MPLQAWCPEFDPQHHLTTPTFLISKDGLVTPSMTQVLLGVLPSTINETKQHENWQD